MQHRRKGRILKRKKGARAALLRSLARAVILNENILTTEARAKEVRPHLERLITKYRSGTLADRRKVIAAIGKDATLKLQTNVLPLLEGRTSGYVRIARAGSKRRDSAPLAYIGFVK